MDVEENTNSCIPTENNSTEPEEVMIKCEFDNSSESDLLEQAEDQSNYDDEYMVEDTPPTNSEQVVNEECDNKIKILNTLSLNGGTGILQPQNMINGQSSGLQTLNQLQPSTPGQKYQVLSTNFGGIKLLLSNAIQQGAQASNTDTEQQRIISNLNEKRVTETPDYRMWSQESTKLLIQLYKKHRYKVGNSDLMKTWKRCWDYIAAEINTLVPSINVTGSHVENRWRVLKRNYDKYINNLNGNLTPGRYRKYFEYANDFNELYGKPQNLNQCLYVVSTTNPQNPVQNGGTIIKLNEPNLIKAIPNQETSNINTNTETKIENDSKPASPETKKRLQRRKAIQVRKKAIRDDILQEMRKERLRYYKQRLSIEKIKMSLEKEKITVMRAKNGLIKERNEILKKFTKQNFLDNT